MNVLALAQGPGSGLPGLATVVATTDTGHEVQAAAFAALMHPLTDASPKVVGAEAVTGRDKAESPETDEAPAAADQPAAQGINGPVLHHVVMAGACDGLGARSGLTEMGGPRSPASSPALVAGEGQFERSGHAIKGEMPVPLPPSGGQALSPAGGRQGEHRPFDGDQVSLAGTGPSDEAGRGLETGFAPRAPGGPSAPFGSPDPRLQPRQGSFAMLPVADGYAEAAPAEPVEGARNGASFDLAVRWAVRAAIPRGNSDSLPPTTLGVPVLPDSSLAGSSAVRPGLALNALVLPAEGAGTPGDARSEGAEQVPVPVPPSPATLLPKGLPELPGLSDGAPDPAHGAADLAMPSAHHEEEGMQTSHLTTAVPAMAPLAPPAVAAGPPVIASAYPPPGPLAPVALPDIPALAQMATSLPDGGRTEIILDPPELGRLRFDVSGAGDQLKIVLSAERPDTLDLLRRHLDQFAAELRSLGANGTQLGFGAWSENAPRDRQARAVASGTRRFDAGSGETLARQVPHALPKTIRAAGHLDIIL